MVWRPDYCTTAEARDFVTTDAADDAFLALAVTAASRAVDRVTGRQFGKVDASEARRYSAIWDRRRCRPVVIIDDLSSATGLSVAVAAGAVTVFELEPVNALAKGRPFEQIVIEPESATRPAGLERNEVTVTTDKWGWSTVPPPVKWATLMQLNRFFARRGSPYGVAGSPDQGSELRLLARADVDVKVAVQDFIRWRAIA